METWNTETILANSRENITSYNWEIPAEDPKYKRVFAKAAELGYHPKPSLFLDGKGEAEDAITITIPEPKFPRDLRDYLERMGTRIWDTKKYRTTTNKLKYKFSLRYTDRTPYGDEEL